MIARWIEGNYVLRLIVNIVGESSSVAKVNYDRAAIDWKYGLYYSFYESYAVLSIHRADIV